MSTVAPAETDSLTPFPSSDQLDKLVAVIAEDADRRRNGDDPPHLAIELIREHRLGAARLPSELGGGGFTVRQLLELLIALGAADPDVPHIVRIHFQHVEQLIVDHGRGEEAEPWFSEAIRGRLIGGAGSELGPRAVGTAEFTTTLRETENGLRLNGTKFYTTGAPYMDFLRVSATGEDGSPAHAIVPAYRSGIEYVNDWDGIGQTHTASGTTRFHNVLVEPADIISRRLPGDPELDRNSLVHLLLHAVAAGIIDRVSQDAVTVLRSRGRSYTFAAAEEPRHDPQLLQIAGELASAAFIARSAVLAAGDVLDRASVAKATGAEDARQVEEEAALAAAKVKVGLEDLALKAAGDLFGVGGSSAIWGGKALDRHWRNLRTLFSHHPTVYKARTVGDALVNGAELPRNGFF